MTASAAPNRLLIVNADDFGLTTGVCRAIVRGHRDGVVTSTSVLALAPAFERCAPWLDDVPALGIGVHLAIVGEDPPRLTAREIPTLVDKHGRLALSWRQLLPRFAARRIDLADVEREFDAQFAAVQAAVGPDRITHLDTHQHLHLWPSIGGLVCRLACQWNVPSVRTTRSNGRSARGRVVNRLARRFDTRARAAGLRTPDAFAGFDEAGALDRTTLVEVIRRLGAGHAAAAEIGIHPGEHGDAELDRYAWGYRWGDELDALTAPEVRAEVARRGFRLGSFAALDTVGR